MSEQDGPTEGDESIGEGRGIALVTGAGSGIGKATAQLLGGNGLKVACFDLDKDNVEQTVEEIRDAGGDAIALAGDICDEVTTKAAVNDTIEHFGGLGVLANVAGVGHYRRSEDESLSDWNRIVDINLTGTFLMCRDAMPALLACKGAIVNVASIAGLAAHAYGAAYSASKGGVVALTKSLAAEYASRHVRVNAVCPGATMTPIIECFAPPEDAEAALVERAVPLMGRFIEPVEIARAIAFLASDSMPNLTGALLVVDGATVV